MRGTCSRPVRPGRWQVVQWRGASSASARATRAASRGLRSAAGAGASFALACDIVLAAKTARFVQAFVKIGLVPDSGASFFLTRTVGEARARALAMLGDAIDGETAAAWGMIWKAVDAAALMPEAEALTAQLAVGPSAALAAMKGMFASAPVHDLNTQLDLEARLQGVAGRGAEFAEGVRAFQEKRPPVFPA